MKIIIDGRVLNKGLTGTGRYLLNLLEAIPEVDQTNQYYVLTNNEEYFFDFFKIIRIKNSHIPEKIYSPIWLNFIIPRLINSGNYDIFFTPNILVPSVKLKRAKKISVVHDVIPKAEKSFYPLSYRIYLNLLLPITFKVADRIVTVSEYSKKDIIKFFGVDENRIEVIYANADYNFKPRDVGETELSRLKKHYNLPDEYLLFVGVLEKRKNIKGLLQIIDKVHAVNSNIHLVLIGKPGYGFHEFGNEIESRSHFVHYLRNVNDTDLKMIYNKTKVFVFPTFYEGFGIPPLEAMQSGIPTVVSDITALPEVVGSSGILVDPNDIEKFVYEINRLLNDENYYKLMSEKGIQEAKKFSSYNSAKKLVELFKKVSQTNDSK